MSAVEMGIIVGNISLRALEHYGWFDERVEWKYEFHGDVCCDEPATPLLIEALITTRTAVAEIDGPFWGVLTTAVTAHYEYEKSVSLTFACCCGTARNVMVRTESKEVPVSESWLWGAFGRADGLVKWQQIKITQECGGL